MRRAALAGVCLVAAALAACGGSSGGDGVRWRSSEVTASLTLTPPVGDEGSWATFPKTATFTAAWNEGDAVSAAGAGGLFGSGLFMRAADGGYRTGNWTVGVPFTDGCGGSATLFFDVVTFSVSGGALSGSATGRARYLTSGAQTIEAPFMAALSGLSDMTAPTLALNAPADSVDPLAKLVIGASEPLAFFGDPVLSGLPFGSTVPLQSVSFNAAELGAGFALIGTPLQYAQTYTLEGEVKDVAGNDAAPLTFSTRAAPPLIPQDGFESVTGTMFSGAAVLHGGPLTPISGETSLLLNTGFGGGFGFLPYDLGPSFAALLDAKDGGQVVRFAFQLISPDAVDSAAFDGVIRLGWPGGAVAESHDLGATQFTKTTLPSLGDIFVSPVRTVSVPLPAAGPGSHLAFEIVGRTFACERPPSPTVLVIDDLRVE